MFDEINFLKMGFRDIFSDLKLLNIVEGQDDNKRATKSRSGIPTLPASSYQSFSSNRLKITWFMRRGKTGVFPEKNFSRQDRQPTQNLNIYKTNILHRHGIGQQSGRRFFSILPLLIAEDREQA